MDPNATLEHIRALSAKLLVEPKNDIVAYELADALQGLDEWLTKGGVLPADWATRED